MNFSRFFNYFIPIFLIALLVTNARSGSSANSFYFTGQPIFFEVNKIPTPALNPLNGIIVDKFNRLLLTNENSVYLFDGDNYQRIDLVGNPIISEDNSRIAIAGKNYLSLLSYDKEGHLAFKQLLDSLSKFSDGQIAGLGIGSDEFIYFSTETKLWKFEEKPILIDSSAKPIAIMKTSKGLVFLSAERGFFKYSNDKIIPLGKIDEINLSNIKAVVAIQGQLIAITENYPWFYAINRGKSNKAQFERLNLSPNDKIIKAHLAGSYLFLSTNRGSLLMVDSLGKFVSSLDNFGGFSPEKIKDIHTADGVNFFAITSNQIWRFINPSLIKVFDYRAGLLGRINSTFNNSEILYIATSNGLYKSLIINKKREFWLIAEGQFVDFIQHNNQLYVASKNNLFQIVGHNPIKLFNDPEGFDKICIVNSKTPRIGILKNQKLYVSNIEKTTHLEDLRINTNYKIKDILSIDSLLFIKTQDSQFYFLNLNDKNSKITECRVDKHRNHSFSEVLLINNNAYFVNNESIKKLSGSAGDIKKTENPFIIGKTKHNEQIIIEYSAIHPDFQSLSEEFQKTKSWSYIVALPTTHQINSVETDLDSNVWISTTEGLIKVTSEYIYKSRNRQQPKISLFSVASIRKNDQFVLGGGLISNSNEIPSSINLKYGGLLKISINTINSFDWSDLTYSVRLDGLNNSWSKWSTDRTYSYNDLRPRKYTFKAKVRDLSGLESPELLFSINLTPDFFQTNVAFVLLLILAILAVYSIYKWRDYNHALERFKLESIINKRTDELVREKEKTDNLLARVLPPDTAAELKETGKVSTQKFNVVTVLFSDIQGFTKITDDLNPENLIDQLDKFFLYFDSVVEKYKIEKIKTIGDAYMCAGGIPQKNRTNPIEVVLAALEMMHFMKVINQEHNPGQDLWDLRIGIDTGPVIAGVVGRNKLSYDIWGTTVNTASRMESSGEVGKINISGNTFILVQDYFLCTYRGRMPIKNKGDIEMYFVDGIKPSLLENLEGVRPNRGFEIQLQILRLGDLEEFILDKLDKGLPKNLYYHNLKHTVDVYTEVELIGRAENVSMEELLLLRTAALFHDAGHMIDYDTHEEMGVKLVREILPEYQYTERQIQIISEIIMATKLPPRPKNLLEAIICDSDLDYLGRTDFIPVSNMLYKELHEHGKIGSLHEWNTLQIKFIEKHQYFTNTARKLRNVNKKSQLENIKNWIEKNKL